DAGSGSEPFPAHWPFEDQGFASRRGLPTVLHRLKGRIHPLDLGHVEFADIRMDGRPPPVQARLQEAGRPAALDGFDEDADQDLGFHDLAAIRSQDLPRTLPGMRTAASGFRHSRKRCAGMEGTPEPARETEFALDNVVREVVREHRRSAIVTGNLQQNSVFAGGLATVPAVCIARESEPHVFHLKRLGEAKTENPPGLRALRQRSHVSCRYRTYRTHSRRRIALARPEAGSGAGDAAVRTACGSIPVARVRLSRVAARPRSVRTFGERSAVDCERLHVRRCGGAAAKNAGMRRGLDSFSGRALPGAITRDFRSAAGALCAWAD